MVDLDTILKISGVLGFFISLLLLYWRSKDRVFRMFAELYGFKPNSRSLRFNISNNSLVAMSVGEPYLLLGKSRWSKLSRIINIVYIRRFFEKFEIGNKNNRFFVEYFNSVNKETDMKPVRFLFVQPYRTYSIRIFLDNKIEQIQRKNDNFLVFKTANKRLMHLRIEDVKFTEYT